MATTEQERDRTKVEERYTWNLADIYPDLATWRAEKERLKAAVPQVKSFARHLGDSARVLADALDVRFRLDKELARLYVYASMLSDQDTRESAPQGMQQEMQQLAADFKAQTAYVDPELLRIGLATLGSSPGVPAESIATPAAWRRAVLPTSLLLCTAGSL